ncbi:uncharacterized protein LOC135398508 [Ornithodoros turicata]|uniref:uncharacterized protein LOC135398508 n=1 Tax=Ornithodoros turicata TaxID=34597 RepID=UPI003138FDEF
MKAEDLGCSPAQLVYGCSLRLPAEFFVESSSPSTPSELLDRLHRVFDSLRPVPTRANSSCKPYVPQQNATATRVFLRIDGVKPSLVPPYTGPHHVLHRSDQTFRILINRREETVSLNTLKPAFLENADPFVSSLSNTTDFDRTPSPIDCQARASSPFSAGEGGTGAALPAAGRRS